MRALAAGRWRSPSPAAATGPRWTTRKRLIRRHRLLIRLILIHRGGGRLGHAQRAEKDGLKGRTPFFFRVVLDSSGRWTTSADKASVKSAKAGDRGGGQAFGSGRVNQVGIEPHGDIVAAEFAD